jgi:integrase/recombinase XerD
MFDTLFHYPRVLARHRDGPAAQERDRFLIHSASAGAARGTLLHLASELLVVARRIDLSGSRPIALEEVEAAAERWVRYQRRHRRIRDPRFSQQRFVQTATDWLRFLGRLEAPREKPTACVEVTREFADHMRSERGLSPRTIHHRCWHVQAFLHWLSEHGGSLASVELEQVDAFLALKGSQGWCRVSIATAAAALRSFFGYVTAQGRCAASLAAGIEGPRLFAQETLPVGPKWSDVRRLIASTATDHPQDLRDRAILLLLAVYGLRCGEVVALTLDDVNWEQNILHVSRPKQRCKQDYPLAAEVGEAILRYLQRVRPRCSSRSLFLTVRAPLRPLIANSLHHLVATRMKALNIQCPRRGPHSLRHACASHLVAEGLSLKQIGDHLGHRSPDATRTYAKVDLAGLRQVADFDLGGLL